MVESRELESVEVDGATVVISVELVDDRTGAGLTSSGGGRGALPTGIRGSTHRWRPRPGLVVTRGEVELELRERHPSAPNWYKIGEAHPDREPAAAAAAGVESMSCIEGSRLAYRLVSDGYDSAWHGLYVRGHLVVHRNIGEHDDCAAALAAFPSLDEFLEAELLAQATDTCVYFAAAGDEDGAFTCLLRHRRGGDRELVARFTAQVGEGADHEPDRELEVFRCLSEAPRGQPGCLRFLAATQTVERRRAFFADEVERCGDNLDARCRLGEVRLSNELARLGDEPLCLALFERVEALTASPEQSNLQLAARVGARLAECVPAARIEALARASFLRDDGSSLSLGASHCGREPELDCESLPQLGAAFFARDCPEAEVQRAREHLARLSPLVLESVPADGALRVLSACAAEEAREVIGRIPEPIPRRRYLERYSLAAEPATVTSDGDVP